MAEQGKKAGALEEHEVEIIVPRGAGKNVRIVEGESAGQDITVRVSKNRKTGAGRAVLGVIVK